MRRRDLKLARVIARVGSIEFEKDGGYYESLVESIIYQQIAGSAARAILGRFKGLYDGRMPTPQEYLDTDARRLRSAGLSPQKVSYIKDLCTRIASGRLHLEKFRNAPDADVVRELDEVRGIGRWTAEMFLIFVLGRTNVLPVDDLGIQKAIQKTYRLRKLPSKEKIEELSEKWQPYCSIATLYLWRALAAKTAAPDSK